MRGMQPARASVFAGIRPPTPSGVHARRPLPGHVVAWRGVAWRDSALRRSLRDGDLAVLDVVAGVLLGKRELRLVCDLVDVQDPVQVIELVLEDRS